MTESDIRVEASEKHGIEVHVPAVSSWDGLETLADFFVKHFGASILNRLDGPDSRIFKVRVRDEDITLVHDDLLGNRFFSVQRSGETVVLELAESLKKAIENNE